MFPSAQKYPDLRLGGCLRNLGASSTAWNDLEHLFHTRYKEIEPSPFQCFCPTDQKAEDHFQAFTFHLIGYYLKGGT